MLKQNLIGDNSDKLSVLNNNIYSNDNTFVA